MYQLALVIFFANNHEFPLASNSFSPIKFHKQAQKCETNKTKKIDLNNSNNVYIVTDGFVTSSILSIIDLTFVTLNSNMYSV